MSNIDKRALRINAQLASSGKWIKESGDGWEAICSSYDQANSGFIIAHFEGPDAKENREFIQAANPATVLALLDDIAELEQRHCGTALLEREEMHAKTVRRLLDELEAKDRRIEDEIARANREHHRGFMMACGHLKEHSNVHYADAAEMEIAALRKRINELESAAAGKGE